MIEALPWLALVGLGAFHGLNPAMGWLFAVGLGLQEGRRRAVLQALAPIALGHGLSIVMVMAAVAAAGAVLPLDIVGYGAGAILVLFGAYKLVRRQHPRWVGMRVGFRDLTVWSFLMASAHGAGLMLVPVLLRVRPGTSNGQAGHSGHATHAGFGAGELGDLLAVGLHTLALFLVMGAVAVIVYDKVGVAIVRRAWFNTDLLWAGALIAAGVLTVVI